MRTVKYLLHLLVLSHAGWSSSDYFQLMSGFFIIYKCCSHHLFSSLVLLGYFPMELCIPHLCSIVESSKPLFGSDTSSKGEVIPKLFSSQRTLVISSSKEINRFAFCCHFLFLAKICNHFLCKRSNRLLFLSKCLQIFWWKLIKPGIKRTKGMCTAYFFYFSVNEKSSKEICCT